MQMPRHLFMLALVCVFTTNEVKPNQTAVYGCSASAGLIGGHLGYQLGKCFQGEGELSNAMIKLSCAGVCSLVSAISTYLILKKASSKDRVLPSKFEQLEKIIREGGSKYEKDIASVVQAIAEQKEVFRKQREIDEIVSHAHTNLEGQREAYEQLVEISKNGC